MEGTEETSVLPAAEGSFICHPGKLMTYFSKDKNGIQRKIG